VDSRRKRPGGRALFGWRTSLRRVQRFLWEGLIHASVASGAVPPLAIVEASAATAASRDGRDAQASVQQQRRGSRTSRIAWQR
jgi:hypothetical protein